MVKNNVKLAILMPTLSHLRSPAHVRRPFSSQVVKSWFFFSFFLSKLLVSKTCESCYSGCLECTGTNKNQCSRCSSGSFLTSLNTCVKPEECPKGSYPDSGQGFFFQFFFSSVWKIYYFSKILKVSLGLWDLQRRHFKSLFTLCRIFI